MTTERIRFYLMAHNSFNAPFNAKLKNSKLDPRGGGDQTFTIPLRRVSDQTQDWFGASWVMPIALGWRPALGILAPSPPFYSGWLNSDTEDWMFGPGGFLEIADTVMAADLRVNTTAANGQLGIYAAYETGLLGTDVPFVQFLAALADTTRKPHALERLPEPV